MELFTAPPHDHKAAARKLTFTGIKHDERGEVLDRRERGRSRAPGRRCTSTTSSTRRSPCVEGTARLEGPGRRRALRRPRRDGDLRARARCTSSGTPATSRCAATGEIWPPDNIEYFLTQIFESTDRNGGERPGMFDAAFLTTRYGSEFDDGSRSPRRCASCWCRCCTGSARRWASTSGSRTRPSPCAAVGSSPWTWSSPEGTGRSLFTSSGCSCSAATAPAG